MFFSQQTDWLILALIILGGVVESRLEASDELRPLPLAQAAAKVRVTNGNDLRSVRKFFEQEITE